MTSDDVIRLRVDATKEAQRRSRLAFLVAVVVSLGIIIVCWNSYLSWYRVMAVEFVTDPAVPEVWEKNPVLEHHHRSLLNEWIASRTISVPLLGIRIGIADANILGGFSLLVISLWFFYSMRRENHLVGELLQDTKEAPAETRDYIFHGISAYLVFTSLSDIDYPFMDLKGHVPRSKGLVVARPALRFLVYLPAVAIGMVILMDILSLGVLPSPFRLNPDSPLSKNLGAGEWVQAMVMLFIAFGFFIITWMFSSHSSRYERSTAKILNQYSKLPRPDEKGS